MASRSFQSVVDFQKELEAELTSARRTLEEQTEVAAKKLTKALRELMSGRLKLRTLRRMKHPYARRFGLRGVAPLLPINVQSGRLRRSLTTVTMKDVHGITVEASVSTPYAEFVLSGTSKMLARPLRKEAEKRVKAIAKTFEVIFGQ